MTPEPYTPQGKLESEFKQQLAAEREKVHRAAKEWTAAKLESEAFYKDNAELRSQLAALVDVLKKVHALMPDWTMKDLKDEIAGELEKVKEGK